MKRKPLLITLTLIVLVALLTAVSSPLSSAIELPAALKPFAFPLFLGLPLLLGLIAALQYFLQEKTEPPVLTPGQQNRQRLIARVRTSWIKGVLEKSLYDAVPIALGLQEQPNAVSTPLRPYLQQPDHQAQPVPHGICITQVYDDADGELLILGEPGSGKTTLLLELARDLLDRAKSDETLPMPLVFNLSSWAVKRRPLADWLVEEINTKYQVPRNLAQSWVQADQVLPLLDGLDEVALPHRSACVEAINTFRKDHGLLPLVVCSRSVDYLALRRQLHLRSAVVVQPLTEQQIDEHLSGAGEQMEAVRAGLRDDPVLQQLATTPLMLNILILVYQDRPLEGRAEGGSAETRQEQLFASYVQHMLKRPRAETRYTPEQTINWLARLARQMRQQDQTIFYIEHIQPNWLPEGKARWFYSITIGLFSLLLGLLYYVQGGLMTAQRLFGYSFPFDWLAAGLIGLLISLLIMWQLGVLEIKVKSAEIPVWSWKRVNQGFVATIVESLAIGLIAGLVFGVAILLGEALIFGVADVVSSLQNFPLVFSSYMLKGLIGGLIGGVLFRLVGGFGTQEESAKVLIWSWKGIQKRWAITLIIAGIYVLIYFIYWLISSPGYPLFGLAFGLFGALGIWCMGGLDTRGTEIPLWSWRSLRKRWVAMLIMGVIGGLISLQIFWIIVWYNGLEWFDGAFLGLVVGLVIWQWSGLEIKIRPAERIVWSWESARKGWIIIMSIALVCALVGGLIYGLAGTLVSGLFAVLCVVVWQGLSNERLDQHHLVTPNQGIRHSARNGALYGLLIGLASGLFLGAAMVLTNRIHLPLSVLISLVLPIVIRWGIISGLVGGMFFGWDACIKHVILRLFLWRAGSMPWNYARFLDYAAERILLRKVGGGYIFVHRLLLEYFATLDDVSIPSHGGARRGGRP